MSSCPVAKALPGCYVPPTWARHERLNLLMGVMGLQLAALERALGA